MLYMYNSLWKGQLIKRQNYWALGKFEFYKNRYQFVMKMNIYQTICLRNIIIKLCITHLIRILLTFYHSKVYSNTKSKKHSMYSDFWKHIPQIMVWAFLLMVYNQYTNFQEENSLCTALHLRENASYFHNV